MKHPDIPEYAIWRIGIDVCHSASHVSFEVTTDKYQPQFMSGITTIPVMMFI